MKFKHFFGCPSGIFKSRLNILDKIIPAATKNIHEKQRQENEELQSFIDFRINSANSSSIAFQFLKVSRLIRTSDQESSHRVIEMGEFN